MTSAWYSNMTIELRVLWTVTHTITRNSQLRERRLSHLLMIVCQNLFVYVKGCSMCLNLQSFICYNGVYISKKYDWIYKTNEYSFWENYFGIPFTDSQRSASTFHFKNMTEVLVFFMFLSLILLYIYAQTCTTKIIIFQGKRHPTKTLVWSNALNSVIFFLF